jgi:hypothetical protein
LCFSVRSFLLSHLLPRLLWTSNSYRVHRSISSSWLFSAII